MSKKINLRNRRLELGLTMKDVANAVGVSESTVSRWEAGNILNMKRNRLVALSNILQTPISNLIEESENTVTTHDKKKPAQLEKILEESEIMFDGELVKLNEEDKQTLKDAIELIYYRAKQKNKRKK